MGDMEDFIEEIVSDTSKGGKYSQFYELLQASLSRYSPDRIKDIKGTLVYVYPERQSEINTYDDMRVLYEYSLLD